MPRVSAGLVEPRLGKFVRFIVLGSSNQARLLVVAFAERPPRTRIISARLASARERHLNEEDL
jgi:uncharacterized DUF497 family protein